MGGGWWYRSKRTRTGESSTESACRLVRLDEFINLILIESNNTPKPHRRKFASLGEYVDVRYADLEQFCDLGCRQQYFRHRFPSPWRLSPQYIKNASASIQRPFLRRLSNEG